MPHLNEKQKEAVNHGDGPLLIIAGAGSGKTHTLTNRLKRLMERGVKAENIIAITFTNKAAKEMLDRISNLQLIESEDSSESEGPITYNLQPFVGTFHSFGARLLKKEARLV